MKNLTKVWLNNKNGHHFALGPDGMSLNGNLVAQPPEWVNMDNAPDMIFGPVIPHNGGECPVAPDQHVRCFFRGRRPYPGGPAIPPYVPEAYKSSVWKHAPAPGRFDSAMDIVAYQVRLF